MTRTGGVTSTKLAVKDRFEAIRKVSVGLLVEPPDHDQLTKPKPLSALAVMLYWVPMFSHFPVVVGSHCADSQAR